MFSLSSKLFVYATMTVIAQASDEETYLTSSISENQNMKAAYNHITAVTESLLPRCDDQDFLRQPDDEEEKTCDSSYYNSFKHPNSLFKPYWIDLLYFKDIQRYLSQFLRDLKLFCEKEGLLFRNHDYDYKKFTNIEKLYSTKLKIYELLSQTENYFCSSVDSEQVMQEHTSVLNGLRIIIADTDRFITSRKRETWTDSPKALENTITIIENLAGFYKHHAELMARIYIYEIEQLDKLLPSAQLKEEILDHDTILGLMFSREAALVALALDLHFERKTSDIKASPRSSINSLSTFLHIPFHPRTSPDNSQTTSPRKSKESKKEEKGKQKQKSKEKTKPQLKKSFTELNFDYVSQKKKEEFS